MIDPALPPDLSDIIRSLESRVAALERSPQLTASSIKDGTLRILDGDGNTVVEVGKIGSSYGLRVLDLSGNTVVEVGQVDSTHGLLVRTASGRTSFRATADGTFRPVVGIPMTVNGGAQASGASFRPGTTSGTYQPIWQGLWWSVGGTVDYDLSVYPNGGSMTWRIRVGEVGQTPVVVVGPTTDTSNTQRAGSFTIPASALLSGTDPRGRDMVMFIDAQRNSGTNPVDVALNWMPSNR